MSRISIDPLTRIEGHLKIEVVVENGVVKEADSSGMMFRGLELMLQGRDPRDAREAYEDGRKPDADDAGGQAGIGQKGAGPGLPRRGDGLGDVLRTGGFQDRRRRRVVHFGRVPEPGTLPFDGARPAFPST